MKKYLYLIGIFLGLSSIQQMEAREMKEKTIVVMETNVGNIEIELKEDVAPIACQNFKALIEKGYYNGTVFHRVIKDFMIQGGDPKGDGTGGQSASGQPFKDECPAHIRFDKVGLLAMANRGPGTNGSQFFITTAETGWLNGKHTIFGEVVKGYDIVKMIGDCKTGYLDRPVEEKKIVNIYLKTKDAKIHKTEVQQANL